jgi:hypothetical protein
MKARVIRSRSAVSSNVVQSSEAIMICVTGSLMHMLRPDCN